MKDGCNNMEKNKILKYFDQGHDTEVISRELKLTKRIVDSIIGHYRAEYMPEVKPKKVKKKKAKAKDTAADEFK